MSATSTTSPAIASAAGMSMNGGDPTSMSMSEMLMVFFTSTNTPLYSMQWMPNSVGQYAGTCIFLIAFAAIFRLILAIRSNLPAVMARATHGSEAGLLRSDFEKASGESRGATFPSRVQRRPWKVNEALVRAVLDTMLAGVSYLLMLAVMTMNVGYFLSVLGGVFLGSFIFGGWTAVASH